MSRVEEFQQRVVDAVDKIQERATRIRASREQARKVLTQYAGDERVSNLYDSDDAFSSAIRDLAGSDFEYPDFAYLSVVEAIKKADKLGGRLADSAPARGVTSALIDLYEVVEDHRPMGERFSRDIRGREKCVAYLANVNRNFNITVFQYREDSTLHDATDEILARAWPETATVNALRPRM